MEPSPYCPRCQRMMKEEKGPFTSDARTLYRCTGCGRLFQWVPAAGSGTDSVTGVWFEQLEFGR